MTQGELQLMKRTAWLNMQRERRTATEEEAAALTGYVVNAVVYTAVLNGILYDFANALKADKVRPCGERAVIKRLHDAARYAHGEIYKVFSNAIDGFGPLYNERYDKVTESIERHISLKSGDRYYNIVLSLLRLIDKNNEACGRFRSPEVIDRIIEGATKEVIELHRFKQILNE